MRNIYSINLKIKIIINYILKDLTLIIPAKERKKATKGS